MPLRVLALCLGSLILHPSSFILKADLSRNNPFIPEGWVPPSERLITAPIIQPPSVVLELKGFDDWNGTKSFYLFDKIKQAGRWINLNDESADTPVLAYNQSGDNVSVDVRINGKVEKITLKKSDGKPLEITGLAAAPAAAPDASGQPGQQPAIPGQPPPPAPVRRRVILPGQAPEPGQTGTPQIDASNPNNAAILKMVEGANSQVAPAIPPPRQ